MKLQKGIIFAIVSVLLVALTSVIALASEAVFGDMNGDNKVNSRDIALLQLVIIGRYEPPAPTPTPMACETPQITDSPTEKPTETPPQTALPTVEPTHEAQIAELRQTIDKLQTALAEKNSTITHLKSENENLKNDIEQLKTRETQLVAANAELETLISEYKEKFAQNEAALNAQSDTINKQNETIKSQEETIADRDKTIADKENIISENQSTIADKNAVISNKDSIIAEKEARISQMDLKIAELEAIIEEYKGKISELEAIPGYVASEAERVIDDVIKAQKSGRTFTFAAISDMHYGNFGYTNGVDNACKALRYIDSSIKLDALAVLGDYTDGVSSSGNADVTDDFQAINRQLSSLRHIPNIRISGNHDYRTDSENEMFRYIYGYNEDVVWGSKDGGYFYKDFEDYKLRIICVNTCDGGYTGLYVSKEQYNWFARSLDLSDKEDAPSWQICILSHHPLDWFEYGFGNYYFYRILNAYNNGTEVKTQVVSYDYNGKNSATVIGNIHGHIHNNMTAKISNTDVWRISTPEACFNRSNTYILDAPDWAVSHEEALKYAKTMNSEKDTSFCVYCIDLENKVIYSIAYGAGYNREIKY